MKSTVFLYFILLLLCFNLFAQSDSTNNQISLVFHYASEKNRNSFYYPYDNISHYDDLTYLIRYGYYIYPNFLVGIGFGNRINSEKISFSTGVGSGTHLTKQKLNIINPYIRIQTSLHEKVLINLEFDSIIGCGDFIYGKNDWGGDIEYYRTVKIFSLRPGLAYSINPILQIEFSFSLMEFSKVIDEFKYVKYEAGNEEYFGASNFLETIRFGINFNI